MRTVELQTGTISVNVTEADLPLDTMCDFAGRRNRKRGFLFVSRRLGRHIGVRVTEMQLDYARLAAKVRSLPLPSGPVLFVGMAETAIALGHGVYQQFMCSGPRRQTAFVHTTRYCLDRSVCVNFLEEHSHAPSHIVYEPEQPADAQTLHDAETLVLVDDEASTGKTFVNLTRALAVVMPRLKLVVTVVLTDWRSNESREATHQGIGFPSRSVSLLSGEYKFTPAAAPPDGIDAPPATGGSVNMDSILRANYGRFGVSNPLRLPPDVLTRVHARPGEKVLVLATGEFAYPPYLLAQHLRAYTADVFCQATSRSPILLGNAIGSALEFNDNYGEGMRNYLYNVQPGQYDRVFIVSETPAEMVDPDLVAMLDAQVVAF